MAPSSRKPAAPSDAAVAKQLGPTRSLWESLRRQIGRDIDPLTEEWVFSGQKHGWALRLKHKRLAVLYLKPLDQCFRISLAMGPGAVALAREGTLPARILRLIGEAVQYPEGKAVRLDIHGPEDVRIALQLAAIKVRSQRRITRKVR